MRRSTSSFSRSEVTSELPLGENGSAALRVGRLPVLEGRHVVARALNHQANSWSKSRG